jgi:putative hydrolase of the HAD superfamily
VPHDTVIRKRGVLLDAMGTLVALEPPAPRLVAELERRWGASVSEGEAASALAAEIAFYKEHHVEGRDEASLADLRLRCAAALHAALPAAARARMTPAELAPALLASLRFALLPSVHALLGAMRAAGLKLAVVSNWDVSLGEVLDQLGLAELLDCVVTSAEAGAAKPDPAVFLLALERLGLGPEEVVHVGDSPELDVAGAEAAGIEAILIEPAGRHQRTSPRSRRG